MELLEDDLCEDRRCKSQGCECRRLGGLGAPCQPGDWLLCFLGEAPAVSVVQWSEGEGVADGISHSIHQGHWWPSRKGRPLSGPEERTGVWPLGNWVMKASTSVPLVVGSPGSMDPLQSSQGLLWEQ